MSVMRSSGACRAVRHWEHCIVWAWRCGAARNWFLPVFLLTALLVQAQIPNQPDTGNQKSVEEPRPQSSQLYVTPEEPVADPAGYCSGVAGTLQRAPALEKVCEFALSMRRKLPDVICDQETKRFWWGNDDPSAFSKSSVDEYHSEVVTAKVSYREGKEYYDDVRVNGHPVTDPNRRRAGGTLSIGEYASILRGIFAPASKTEFKYEKEEKVNSVRAVVFAFHVLAENNKTYFLELRGQVWFPEYHGEIWINKETLDILRLERETPHMNKGPLRSVKTQVDYSRVSLGDGTDLVLPMRSRITTCLPDWNATSTDAEGTSSTRDGTSEKCSSNNIKFANWKKFRATTKIIGSPPD